MFGTSGIRGPVGETVTADVALAVGRAVVSTGADRVIVGRDARESGELLQAAVSAGIRECGGDVIDIGRAATPTVARSVGWQDADAGIMITASHNPPQDNGLKLWTPSGQAFDAEQRAEITDCIENEAYELEAWDKLGTKRTWTGAQQRHVDTLCDAVGDVESLSVVVDLGNGVGQVTVDALVELGCDVETLNGQPDGRFPGRPSEPTAETCASLCTQVANSDADLGLAHDGDADRLMAVDESGEFVSGDELLALFAQEAVSEGDRVAAPVNTSLAVDDSIASEGASVVRTQVGDVFVAEQATASDVVFGGEPSGAWIWPAETLCPDGPLAACKLVELVSHYGSLSTQVDAIGSYPIRRDSFDVDDKTRVMAEVAEQVNEEFDDVSTLDGVRVEHDDGWFLIRASGTQPLIQVTAEARSSSQADKLFDTAANFVATVKTDE